MRSIRRTLVALAVAAVAAACANPPAASDVEGAPTPARVDRNVITQQEILDKHFINAYDAVEGLRAFWLSSRGTDSFRTPSQVWVYMDNVKLGDVETLRTIHPSDILSIRHFDANEANARWGVGHSAGVIYVTTFKGDRSLAVPPQ